MLINFKNINLHFDFDEKKYKKNLKPIFLLHGFTGSSNDWKDFIDLFPPNFNPISIDLIGHGKSDSPDDLSFYNIESIIEQILKVTEYFKQEKFFLLGYSMGGRAALSFANKYLKKVEGLVLESTTAGIKNENEQLERIKNDEKLSEFILNHSIEEFIGYWMNLDIFNTQKRFSNEKLKEIREAKIENNKTGLANLLKGFSTGKILPLYDKLKNISAKTLLITGELDEKFTKINSEVVNLFPNAEHKIIKNAGHNTHLEEPKKFIESVNNFLDKSCYEK